MGRPTKFSTQVAETICEAVEAGNFLVTAAALAGVDADTVYSWLQQAQRTGAPADKREFLGALTRARARAEAAAVDAVFRDMRGGVMVEETIYDDDGGRTTRKFSPPNGTVALKYLQRAFPDRWADRKPIDPTGGEDDDQGGMGAPSSLKALTERLHEEINAASGEQDDIADGEIVPDP